MLETAFRTELHAAVPAGRIKWEKMANPLEFDPPCSYRAEVTTNGKRHALNFHEGVCRIYDDIGLVAELTGMATTEALIDTEVHKRDPEKVFDKLVAAWTPPPEPEHHSAPQKDDMVEEK